MIGQLRLEKQLHHVWCNLVIGRYCETKVWLISILMITKQGLKLMIIFQVWLDKKIFKVTITKIKSNKREINMKKKALKRSYFQDLSFIRSFCKVVGALDFLCITSFIYAPKSSKSYFVLNFLKLDDFMFSTKTLCQMLSNFV